MIMEPNPTCHREDCNEEKFLEISFKTEGLTVFIGFCDEHLKEAADIILHMGKQVRKLKEGE